jgi:hypothetical protein
VYGCSGFPYLEVDNVSIGVEDEEEERKYLPIKYPIPC